MGDFEIFSNLPESATRQGTPPSEASKYPFRNLEVGQMFFFEGAQSAISARGYQIGRATGRKFATRKGTHNGKDGFWVERMK